MISIKNLVSQPPLQKFSSKFVPQCPISKNKSLFFELPANLRAAKRNLKSEKWRYKIVSARSENSYMAPNHHLIKNLPPSKHLELTAEQSEERVNAARKEIEAESKRRALIGRETAVRRKLDCQLKFGKLLMEQKQYSKAIPFFEKVASLSPPHSSEFFESTYCKAQCFDFLDRHEEAKELYLILLKSRGPFPYIKRKVAKALYEMENKFSEDKEFEHGTEGGGGGGGGRDGKVVNRIKFVNRTKEGRVGGGGRVEGEGENDFLFSMAIGFGSFLEKMEKMGMNVDGKKEKEK